MRRDMLVERFVKPAFVIPVNTEALLPGLKIRAKLIARVHVTRCRI